MKKFLLLPVLCFLVPAWLAGQTNITLSNPAALPLLQGNYDPGDYTPSSVINDPDSILQGVMGRVSKDTLISWLMQIDSYYNRNGDLIPNVTDNSAWSLLTTGARCYYDNDSATYAGTYGALYNFFAVDDSRGLCPAGWHVANVSEWNTLTGYLGGNSVAGGKMKAARLWVSPNAGELNTSGFSALPHGHRFSDGSFDFNTVKETWWTSTHVDPPAVWYRAVINNSAGVIVDGQWLEEGLSVRCLRD